MFNALRNLFILCVTGAVSICLFFIGIWVALFAVVFFFIARLFVKPEVRTRMQTQWQEGFRTYRVNPQNFAKNRADFSRGARVFDQNGNLISDDDKRQS